MGSNVQSSMTTPMSTWILEPEPSFGDTMRAAMTMSTPLSTPIMSSPLVGLGNIGSFDASGNFIRYEDENPNVNMEVGNISGFTPQQRSHRESFGSVFPGSSGTGGNGNGESHPLGMTGMTQQRMPNQVATFNIRIKPKEPPVFHGRANEDVDTWLAKVGDFI